MSIHLLADLHPDLHTLKEYLKVKYKLVIEPAYDKDGMLLMRHASINGKVVALRFPKKVYGLNKWPFVVFESPPKGARRHVLVIDINFPRRRIKREVFFINPKEAGAAGLKGPDWRVPLCNDPPRGRTRRINWRQHTGRSAIKRYFPATKR